MSRSLRTVRCPHAKPDDLCQLPPGVRYCVCYGDVHRDPVGQVSVQGGQVVWSVAAASGGRPRGAYTWVAVVRQGATVNPVELHDDASLRETVEGGQAFYVVRGPRDTRYRIDAGSLVEAAVEHREYLDATPMAHA
jgi:alpha-ketoglutarate-dependent taurine dioxygenase